MSAVARIERAGPTVLGLNLPEHTTFDEWVDIGRRLSIGQQAVQWKIGDWWAFGDHRYGDRAKAAAEGIFGHTFGTLRVYGSVAKAFEPLRRLNDVPFAHHQEVASLPAKVADQLLARAESEKLSTRDLRREVQALKAANDPGTEADREEPPEARARVFSDAERDAAVMASLVIEVAGRFKAGEQYSEWDDIALQRASNFLADAYNDRKPVPDDFAVMLREHGRPGCELHYAVGRRTINRWIQLSGLDTTVFARRRYVDYQRSQARTVDGRSPIERLVALYPPSTSAPIDHQLAAAAMRFMQAPGPRRGWTTFYIPQTDRWCLGNLRLTGEEMIQRAKAAGFDADAALAGLESGNE